MARRIERHRTALRRTTLSRPMRHALEDGLIHPEASVFDYGCGLGGDVSRLRAKGINARGWDPVHRPNVPRSPAEVVNLGYVVNVIEDPSERAEALQEAWRLTKKLLVVSARLTLDVKESLGEAYGDGCCTKINTFQKLYEQDELRGWLEASLEAHPVPAAPGVFYVFRKENDRQAFLSARFRRTAGPRLRAADRLYEEHRTVLQPLLDFLEQRGRPPRPEELPESRALIDQFGSVGRAFRIVRVAVGDAAWQTVRRERSADLLVYLALSRFTGRPKFSDLPSLMRGDIKAFFGSYTSASKEADDLLFSLGEQQKLEQACIQATVGKLTPTALYVHHTALEELPPLLRVYEGSARALVGRVEGANLFKLHRRKPQISYLSYPGFETDPHPSLSRSLKVELSHRSVRARDFSSSANPPILHRKELFMSEAHPLRAKFARLTRQEDQWGLLANPSEIGLRQGWERVLERTGVATAGHRVVRRRSPIDGKT